MVDAKERGRRAYAQRAWEDAYQAFMEAGSASLVADDAELFALAASLSGHEDEAIEGFARLHQLRLDGGEVARAARAAFWAGMRLFSIGEMARGSGWIARAQRLVDSAGQECVECGYLRLPLVVRLSAAGEHAVARATAIEAGAIGTRHGDHDLCALARTFEGRALIRDGKLAAGLSLLDEAMVAVTRGELSPVVTGVIYCGVIAACQQSYALDRAREWTASLSAWCAAQPQLVPFAGACLVHRSEIMQLGGAWPDAVIEAHRACARLAGTKEGDAGNAFYQQGELHRLRGELSSSEDSYARASERGRDPQPGLALLRLAQGRVDLAAAAMRRVLDVTREPVQRTRFLPAHVEIMLAAGDLGEARRAADELSALAAAFGMELLGAIAQHAGGAVTLAEGDARSAIAPLRSAQEAWQRAGAPYPSARIRVVVARAFQALGDVDGAVLELSAARKVFLELGAAPDLALVETISQEAAPVSVSAAVGGAVGAGPRAAHGLSAREQEVLLLVASGKTNRVIAATLFVSEKTVDRHVSNILRKLEVPSRAAATAWAYRHGLVG